MLNRRGFMRAVTGAGASVLATSALAQSRASKPSTRILLRSSWQTVNIGDIAHTPGMLTLLEKHLPNAAVTLWPSSVDRGVEEILRKRFRGCRLPKAARNVKGHCTIAIPFCTGPGGAGRDNEMIRARDMGNRTALRRT